MVEESAFQAKTPIIMSVPPSEGPMSPTKFPDEPVVGILGTAVEGRSNPGGFEISDPVDVCLTEAIAQARTLATDEESVLEFPTPMTAPHQKVQFV